MQLITLGKYVISPFTCSELKNIAVHSNKHHKTMFKASFEPYVKKNNY